MGKQGSPRSRLWGATANNVGSLIGMKKHQFRCSEAAALGNKTLKLGSKRSIKGVGGEYCSSTKVVLLHGFGGETSLQPGSKRQLCFGKHLRFIALSVGVMGFLLFLDSLMFFVYDSSHLQNKFTTRPSSVKAEQGTSNVKKETTSVVMYTRLFNLASRALAENEFRYHQKSLWNEQHTHASAWKPCSNGAPAIQDKPKPSNGLILVSANGGLNQQRVAVCNAVAVASLLNATLVIPKFLYSNVWKDPSQFGDIYQEEYFIKALKNDVNIVKQLPPHLRSIDLEAIGSVITDSDLEKEAKPNDYMRVALPPLRRNGIVHFLGFGNRLGFDPLPSRIQKLRCKCNFHALKFAPKIQKAGSVLVRRIRKNEYLRNTIDKQLLGSFIQTKTSTKHVGNHGPLKYLALHLRFEEDMVAYSLCDFGGGETERRELQAYRETHFPLMLERLNKSNPANPSELRLSGRCPLTPEESALVLAGLGFKRATYIYLAGSQIYGGQTRMKPFTSLYPNVVTKENLLSATELEPFRNFSSQLAALDFIACATADVFAITDSGSQLSSLVSGYRAYFGGGQAPILRPNKKRLAAILLDNSTIGWTDFGDRVQKMIELGQIVHRGYGQSLYRQPTTPECMCRTSSLFEDNN